MPPGAQGYDRYAYVNNDPIKYTDPTGHDPLIPYPEFIQGAIDFFQNMGYAIVGTVQGALDKDINTNGADLVFQKAQEVLTVELKNISGSVNLGTLGKSTVENDYGGSISRVLRSANRFRESNIDQLRAESRAILDAGSNLKNALYTNADKVSKNAAAQFNQVYAGMKDNIDKTVPPAVAAAQRFIQTVGNYDLVPFIMPVFRISPNGPFSPSPLAPRRMD